LKNTWQMHQPTRTTEMLDAVATSSVPAAPRTSPVTIHGRRIPNREVVRSLRRPNSVLATMDSSDPMPATMARLRGAASMPTRSLTFKASDTNRGARNSREPPVKDSPYRVMKAQPTRLVGPRVAVAESTASSDRPMTAPWSTS
jgi:hypothetical protein